jgi:hypothetical protein
MYLYAREGLGQIPTTLGPGIDPIGSQNELCPRLQDMHGRYLDWLDYVGRTRSPNDPLSKYKRFINEDAYRAYVESCKQNAIEELLKRIKSFPSFPWSKPQTPKTPQTPTSLKMRGPLGEAEQTAGWFGEPAQSTAPAFRFICPTGCAPQAANQCIGIVRRAIQDAIWLAENAAEKLISRDGEALGLFRFFFGDPERLVPWANNRPAADLVADRFRAVAHGFRTRVPHIRCAVVGPGAEDCGPGNAFVVPRRAPTATIPLPRNTILLCPPFWGAAPAGTVLRFWRAAILLHEMLHLLYWQFFGHQVNLPRPGDPEERRRDNSHCYEAFALRVAKHGADAGDVTACTRNITAACAADPTTCGARPF